LLTNHPAKWQPEISITDCNGKVIEGHIHALSDRAEEVISSAELVILCVPGFLIEQTLVSIKDFLSPTAQVGSVVCSNGFFWMAKHILGDHASLFGFQRVPYICRVTEYGKSAAIKGYKSLLKLAGSPSGDSLEKLSAFFSETFDTPIVTLNHYLEVTLTNSNPLLHPSRIYGMLSREETDSFDHEFLFYEEWDDFSSETLINCDAELQQLLKRLPANRQEIPSILDYYESTDAASLTRKIRSINAFKGIKMSMKQKEDGCYYIDYTNRYFIEDIPYGLLIVKSIAELIHIDTPCIDAVLQWMQTKMGKQYLNGSSLEGKDLPQTGVVRNFGISTPEQLACLSTCSQVKVLSAATKA
jgi:hypothetical protein